MHIDIHLEHTWVTYNYCHALSIICSNNKYGRYKSTLHGWNMERQNVKKIHFFLFLFVS